MFIIISEELNIPMDEQLTFAIRQIMKYNKKPKVTVKLVTHKGHTVEVVWAKTKVYTEKLAIENARMYIKAWLK